MVNNDALSIQKELKELLLSKGVSDVGFSYLGNADSGDLQNGISIVVKLSDAIIDEIAEEIGEYEGDIEIYWTDFNFFHGIFM